MQDIASFDETQETLALLKILALGNQDVAAGKIKPVANVVARLRTKQVTARWQARPPGSKSCSPRVPSKIWRPFTTTSPMFDCVANANYVLDELMAVVESLSKFPERGSFPKELSVLGIKEYRQTFFKPYRLIHRVTSSQVIIYLIADGRRDMQSVLARRLLGA